MKVEIWSDVMCPFCYIGKRKFEAALESFKHNNEVRVEWKSFQLNPTMKTDPTKNINKYLSEIKGWDLEQAKKMNASVTAMAEEVGLHYDFDKAVVANSFDAHRLIQLAKKHNKGDAAEECLFRAYFTEGKNIADHEVLLSLAVEIGLEKTEVINMLKSNTFAVEVAQDIEEARHIGVRGVPFFVIDRRYGISGAQQAETFLDALNKAREESSPLAEKS
jgi:predicted DsbA family dithiol-disulfide isomerase